MTWGSCCSRLKASLKQGPVRGSSPLLCPGMLVATWFQPPLYLLTPPFPYHHDIETPLSASLSFLFLPGSRRPVLMLTKNAAFHRNINSKLFHSKLINFLLSQNSVLFFPVEKTWQPNNINDFVTASSLVFCSLFFHNSVLKTLSFTFPLLHPWVHLTNFKLLSSVNLPTCNQLSC